MQGPEKLFFYETILGVIFGFEDPEKQKYRGDPALNKTFTAVLTISLDQRTMIIERDFETDFVAYLISDTESSHCVFQGKDKVDNDNVRPYTRVLQSIFQIIDKKLFLEVGQQLLEQADSKLSDYIDILCFLLTPERILHKANALINKCIILEQEGISAIKSGSQIVKYRKLHQAVKHLMTMKDYEDHIQSDKLKLDSLIKKIQSKQDLTRQMKELVNIKFSGISSFDPVQLRADVEIWKSLQNVVALNEKKLRELKGRKRHIKNILKSELSEFANVPQTFKEDVQYFNDSKLRLNYINEAHKDYTYLLEQAQNEYRKINNNFITISFLNVFVFFLVSSLIVGPAWSIVLPLAVFPILVLFPVSLFVQSKKKKKINKYQLEANHLEDEVNSVKTQSAHIAENIKSMQGQFEIEILIQKYQNFQDFKGESQSIQEEIGQLTELILSDEYQGQIDQFKRKYGQAIDIHRDDLEKYLDDYQKATDDFTKLKQNLGSYPAMKKMRIFVRSYTDKISDLKKTRLRLTKALNIENGTTTLIEALEKLDRKIMNLELS